MLPLVVVLALGIVQVALVVRDQLAVELAAREGARAAAVAATPVAAAERAAQAATTLRPLAVLTSVGAVMVTVEVRFQSTTEVPLLGLLISDVEVVASVSMVREPP